MPAKRRRQHIVQTLAILPPDEALDLGGADPMKSALVAPQPVLPADSLVSRHRNRVAQGLDFGPNVERVCAVDHL